MKFISLIEEKNHLQPNLTRLLPEQDVSTQRFAEVNKSETKDSVDKNAAELSKTTVGSEQNREEKNALFITRAFDAPKMMLLVKPAGSFDSKVLVPEIVIERLKNKGFIEQVVIFSQFLFKRFNFLQIVDFLGSACCSCTHFRGQFNKLRYCAKTVHLFVHIFVSACFGRTNFTNMHKNDCATRAQFCATRAQFQKVVRYHSKDAASPYT